MGVIELEILAPMLVSIILILTVGGVLILRPIAKRLGDLLEVMTRERLEGPRRDESEHTRELLETISHRLSLIEDRQDFTDRLLESGDTARRIRDRSSDPAD